MRVLGSRLLRVGRIPGHQRCRVCHPRQEPSRSRERRRAERWEGVRLGRVVALSLLLLSASARAEDVLDVQRAQVLTAAGLTLDVEGGVWLSDAQLERTSRELVRLRAENEALREAPPMPPLWTLGVAVAIGLAAGLAVGLAGR